MQLAGVPADATAAGLAPAEAKARPAGAAGPRVASSAYARSRPAPLSLVPASEGGVIAGWAGAVRRAHGAPALLRPGLLAAHIPGGAAYAGIAGTDTLDAVLASDEAGRVRTVSIGQAGTVAARAAA